VATRIQIRRSLSTEWTSLNPTLASGEIGFETDTLKIKIGNGSSNWNTLQYATTGSVGDLFNKSVDDLDDINDGTVYQKVSIADKAALDNGLTASTNHIADESIHTELADIQALAFKGAADVTKEVTGFYSNTSLDNSDIIVTYDSINRTITLTGDFVAFYEGVIVPSLISGWVSDPHPIGSGTYFLYYNGTSFVWGATPWDFTNVMIALVFRDTANFCLRETHGLMQWQSHKSDHQNLGTYLLSGGDAYDYTLSSTTASERRPLLTECRVADEDLTTIIPALSTEVYTRLQLSLANNTNFVQDSLDIINLDGNRPYYNQFTGGNWVQTLFPNNAYGKIFIMAIPVTADAECQKNRFVFIQPQAISTTLSTIQAVTTASVNLGHISTALAEYCFIGEIIVRYAGGNWTMTSYSKITGNRTSQTILTGNFLSNVATDTTIDGDGTGLSPLSIANSLATKEDTISGIPNTFAYHGTLGALESNEQFIRNAEGGTDSAIVRNFDSAITNIRAHLRTLNLNPTENSPSTFAFHRLMETNFNTDFNLFRVFNNYNIMRKQGTGSVQNFLLDNNEMNFNAGTATGITALRSGYMSFGGGPNATQTDQTYLTTDSALVTSNHTYTGMTGTSHNINLSGGSIGNNFTGFSSSVSTEETTVIPSMIAYTSNATINHALDYYTTLNSGPNITATATALGVTGFFFNPSFEGVVDNYSGVSLNGYGSVPPTNFTGAFVNPSYSNKLAQLTGYQVSNNCEINDATGFRASLGNGTDANNIFCFDANINVDELSYGRGFSFQGTALDVVSGFDGLYVDVSNVVGANVLAARLNGDVVIQGDLDLTGGLNFNGDLNVGKLSAFSTQTVVNGGGVPSSVHGTISAVVVPDNATIAFADTIGTNTAMLAQIGENATVTSGPFNLGLAALALPAVVTTSTGCDVDYVHGALFAVNLDGLSTGGTLQNLIGCRSTFVPNGVTQVDRAIGYLFNVPFGDVTSGSTWGVYIESNVNNYLNGNLKIGGSDKVQTDVAFEIESTKAFLPPKLTSTERSALTPIKGMTIFNTTTDSLEVYSDHWEKYSPIKPLTSVSSNYNAVIEDSIIIATGTIDVTLPSHKAGKEFTIKNNGTGIVTITNISYNLIAQESIRLISDGATWLKI
jgi:hypothetical protein